MKKNYYEGKNLEEAKEKALAELEISEEDLLISQVEEKNSLLKKNVKIEVIDVNEVINYIKETINEITKLMNIESNLEVRRREKNISIKIFSNNNSILIGKNGRTIGSLQILLKQMISNQVNAPFSISLDVENYKEKKLKNIEFLAKKVARDVARTKTEAKLDSMNSYERRIVHSVLTDDKYVYTESAGEEPNRYVVIKPREE